MKGETMFSTTLANITLTAKNKLNRLKKAPLSYFILSMFGGMFIGFAILLTFTIGGLYAKEGSALGPIPMGLAFGMGMSLVLFVGSELFTGNVMIMSIARARKEVSTKDLLSLWVVCYLGNMVGSMLLGFIFYHSGLTQGYTGEFFIKAATMKMTTPGMELIMRGILCNILVCCAVWTFYRMDTEVGKLIMVFWPIFGFITPTYEHSVANMTVHTVAILMNQAPQVIHLGGALHNLLYSTIGNILGGSVFFGLAYAVIGGQEHKL